MFHKMVFDISVQLTLPLMPKISQYGSQIGGLGPISTFSSWTAIRVLAFKIHNLFTWCTQCGNITNFPVYQILTRNQSWKFKTTQMAISTILEILSLVFAKWGNFVGLNFI